MKGSLITSIAVLLAGGVMALAGLGIRIGGAEQILPPVSFLVIGAVCMLGGAAGWLYTVRTGRPFF